MATLELLSFVGDTGKKRNRIVLQILLFTMSPFVIAVSPLIVSWKPDHLGQ
ncbi:MAG: hypothetical protein KGI38_02650 [Thaumarchaeota archaeon]|nr:hypothetical protein [Nitrososphaerota archaeon]